jgi:hypothetical protein
MTRLKTRVKAKAVQKVAHSAIDRGYGLLKPDPTKTLATIRLLRGSLKRKPGQKSFAQEWAEHTASEKALEDRLDRRLRS